MANFINYETHGITLDIRNLERWALEREQHDENYDDFVRKLSDRIITIENKLDNGCRAKNNVQQKTVEADSEREQIMNVYLVELPADGYSYGDDYAMVVIAEDELHAERKARWSSHNFKQAKKITISQVNLSEETVVLKANLGG